MAEITIPVAAIHSAPAAEAAAIFTLTIFQSRPPSLTTLRYRKATMAAGFLGLQMSLVAPLRPGEVARLSTLALMGVARETPAQIQGLVEAPITVTAILSRATLEAPEVTVMMPVVGTGPPMVVMV